MATNIDAATEALIAQFVAEDLNEATRISWLDYEDPLSFYEQQRLLADANPDEAAMQTSGWGPIFSKTPIPPGQIKKLPTSRVMKPGTLSTLMKTVKCNPMKHAKVKHHSRESQRHR